MSGCVALVVAGGRGRRFGGDRPKQYLRLRGKPLLRYSLETFLRHPRIERVRVVIRPDDRALYDEAAEGLDILAPCPGGAERQDSARLGLESLVPLAPSQVLIHDAARPFIDAGTIARVVEALELKSGAIAAVPVTDTLKRASDAGSIAGTIERARLWRAQTPQGFRFPEMLAAHRAAAGLALTDDAAVAERAGLEVALVAGSEENIKITSDEDLRRAEHRLAAAGELRVGTGFDVHQFGAGDSVMLCGLKIAHDRGLVGHSDADVGLHALTDALLGTIAAGDIGAHFPPSDPQWRGVSSDRFLHHAGELVARRGGAIVNLDVTIICERPKISQYRAAMAARVAAILGIAAERVSVKGTTTDGLGFAGRGEGIGAQAVATVRLAPLQLG